MKKLIYTLLALFIMQLSVSAQQGDTRTTTTKIADLLALQPSENPQRLQDAMGQLERFSASDIATLLGKLTPPGEGSDTGVEYASNSYSYYVLLPGKDTPRATFIKGAVGALSQLTDNDSKGFVIQLLQNAGNDAAVDALRTYLNDVYLSEKASRALARIETDAAGKALADALPDATDLNAVNIVNALGFMAYAPAEQSILAKAASTDAGLRKAALYALSRIGGLASESVLSDAAKAAGYVYEPTEATAAYVNYMHRLIARDDAASARKMASRLLKQTDRPDQVHTRIAALGLLTEINKGKQVNTLLKLAKDSDAVYRNASLGLLVPYLDDHTTARLIRNLPKAGEQVQVDVIHYLGEHQQSTALPEIRRAMYEGSSQVRVAAVEALHKLGGATVVKEVIGLLSQNDPATRKAVKQVLLTSESKQLPQLVSNALSAERDGTVQVLLIDVLAQRGVGESVPMILGIIRSDASNEVKDAAYAALPQVARPADLDQLLDLMSSTNGAFTAPVQEAAVAAVIRSDNKETQTQRVISRLKGAKGAQKLSFFPILAGIGGQTTLAVVSAFTNQEDAALRGAATTALANWNDAGALSQLVLLSRKKVTDAGQLDIVIKGLVRVIGIADVPAEQQVLYLRDVFAIAQTTDQRKLVLRALEGSKTYNALLFAGKFIDDEQLSATAANTVMDIALEDKRFYGAEVNRLLHKVIERLSGSESSYLREAVQKHLNELPKGAGFVSLFNGTNLDGWKGLVGNPIKRASMDAKTLAEEQVKADKLMHEGWQAERGELQFNGHGDNIATTKQYGDFELFVDWKLAKVGKDGDAGIYLRGTPQVQIWDTSRVNVGAQVGSGGLYNNQTHESKPIKVADNALGEWNTFRILMVGDHVTVYLNGELVTDSVVLENYWDRGLPIFPREQIELQAHGTHVSYRDIYIRELPRKEVSRLSEAEKREGFDVLFDGTDLDEWTGNTTAYLVSDEGTLAIYPTEGSGGNLYSKEEFSDFVYRFEFRLTPGANNGIGIRSPMEGDAAYAGMEIQVLDDGADMYKDLAEYQYHGSVYGVIPAKRGHLKPVGEWNEEEIRVQGNKIKVTLNGTVIVDGDLAAASKNGTLDHKEHPGLKRKSGHIAFLGHGSEVHFRNIRVKRL